MSSSTLTKAQPAGTVSAAVTTAQLFPNKQTPAVPVTLGVLGSGRLEGKKFTVRASGSVTTGAALTPTVTFYIAKTLPANPFTAANWAVIGTVGAAVNTTTAGWLLEASLQFESIGGSLQGSITGLINNQLAAVSTISNVLAGLNGTSNTVTQAGTAVPAAEPVFVVAAGITFSVANANNIATLLDFVLDG